MKKDALFWRNFFIKRLKITAIIAAVILLLLLTVRCPIRFLTGIPCPGCGMTRACVYALSLDFERAFSFHPLWWTAPLLFLYFFFDELLPKKLSRICLVVFAVLYVGIYVYRMAVLRDPVVTPKLSDGLLYRIIFTLKG